MSRTSALRTYTFTSPATASQFSPLFKNAKTTMERDYDTLVTGYWISRTNPVDVFALVHHPANEDAEQIKHGYLTSEAFKKDCEEHDLSAVLIGLEEALLDPVQGI